MTRSALRPRRRMATRLLPAFLATAALILVACADGTDESASGTTEPITADADVASEPRDSGSSAFPPEPEDPENDPAGFTVDGDTAFMSGVIFTGFDEDLAALFDQHPEVDRIVMTDVPGSADDEANLAAARILHDAGITTEVPSDGIIASGGTDLFLAGRTRVVAGGARVGVHSWATSDGTAGADLSDDDPEHDPYLDYYDQNGIDADFYWFTLDAAGPDDIHFMTADELDRFGIATG